VDLVPDGSRDAREVLAIAIGAVDTVASVVSVLSLRAQVPALAAALRRWVQRRPPDERIFLTVTGPGVDLRLELKPNVGARQIVEALLPLLPDG
jgi:hypothetical protein